MFSIPFGVNMNESGQIGAGLALETRYRTIARLKQTIGKAYIIARDTANGACLVMVSDQDVLAALQSVPGPDGKNRFVNAVSSLREVSIAVRSAIRSTTAGLK